MGTLIPGITKGQLEGTTAEAGLRMFPFPSNRRWIQHSAEVISVEIVDGKETDHLIVKGRNGEYGVRISVQLDPRFIAHNYGQDTSRQIERNTEKLLKVLKALDLAVFKGNGVLLEPNRFEKTIGKVFLFSISGSGRTGKNGLEYANISFKGLSPDNRLTPVVVPDGMTTEMPQRACATKMAGDNVSISDGDDDIPF